MDTVFFDFKDDDFDDWAAFDEEDSRMKPESSSLDEKIAKIRRKRKQRVTISHLLGNKNLMYRLF